MKRLIAVNWFTSLIESVLPRDIGELVAGDLQEEYLLMRTEHASPTRATWWFLLQAVTSIPRLWIFSARRLVWLKALGAAVIAYLALGLLEPRVHQLNAFLFDPQFQVALFVDILVGFAACALGGFLATWMQRGAAVLYSVIGTGFLISAVPNAVSELPLWFITVFLVIAPVAPIIGGTLFIVFTNRRET